VTTSNITVINYGLAYTDFLLIVLQTVIFLCIVRDDVTRRAAGWHTPSSERHQPHQPDTQRGCPVSQVVVHPVASSPARSAGWTAECFGRCCHRQLQTDVDLLVVASGVRISPALQAISLCAGILSVHGVW